MNAEDLRKYASRGWSVLEQEKDRWRADRFRSQGPAATVAASLALREQGWRIAGPPTDERRQADLADHVELKRKLERVSRALEALMEQALDQRDLLPAFEAALARARRAKPT